MNRTGRLALLTSLVVAATLRAAPPRDAGDDLPSGATLRLGTARLRHGCHVKAVLFTADGKAILSAGWDGDVCLWDAADGQLIRRFEGLQWPQCLALSPDGKSLAAGDASGQYAVALWDVGTGKLLGRLQGHCVGVKGVAFSPDGKTLASGSWDGTVRLWDVTTHKESAVLNCTRDGVNAVAFAPDGKHLAVACRGFSSDREPDDLDICLWDVATRRVASRLRGHRADVEQVAFTPGGRTLLSISRDGTLRVWNLKDGKQVRKWATSEGRFALCDRGRQVIARDDDGALCVWEVAGGKEVERFKTFPDRCEALAVDPAGKLLAFANDGFHAVRLFDLGRGKERPLAGHIGRVVGLASTPDGRHWLTASQDGTLRVWSADDGRCLATCPTPDRYVSSLALAADGRSVALGSNDGRISRWEVPRGRKLSDFPLHSDWALAVSTFPDGKHLVSGSHDRVVRLTEAETGKEVAAFRGHRSTIAATAVSPDGTLVASGSNDATVRLWRPGQPGKQRTILETGHPVYRLTFSPDGTRLAAVCEGRLLVWPVSDKGEVGPALAGPQPAPIRLRSVAFAADGRSFAAGDEQGVVRVWETATVEERTRFAGRRSNVEALAFGPDGRHLASAGDDTFALVWALRGGHPGRKPPGNRERESAWKTLAEGDARAADVASWALASAGKDSVRFLASRLKPAERVPADTIARILADLDSDSFRVREKAAEDLEAIAERAEPALRQARRQTRSAEVRRRLDRALDRLAGPRPTPETLRIIRAVETLERIGSAEAVALLRELAGGAPEVRTTREARASLRRLAP